MGLVIVSISILLSSVPDAANCCAFLLNCLYLVCTFIVTRASLDDQMILPYPEPLIHFALVLGNRSGPSLQCYSPGNIDKELTDAARDFLRNGGLVLDLNAKVASVSKILNW